METKNAERYLESSFLAPLLAVKTITDISYNGDNLYFVDNRFGRRKAEVYISDDQCLSFLRQVANLSEKSFNVAEPILDVSFGPYRLSAVHSSIGRHGEKKAPSFSLRIASRGLRVGVNPTFLEPKARDIILQFLRAKESVLIGGVTGSGKTELQKWLLASMEENTRVLVLDNVEELSLVEGGKLDMTTWMTEASPKAGLQELIRNALRHHPDYLLVAEARGKEMADALYAAGSGHPLIMTMHAKSLSRMPDRVCRMAKMGYPEADEKLLWEEVCSLLPNYIFLEKKSGEDGSIERYVQGIGRLSLEGRFEILYERSCK